MPNMPKVVDFPRLHDESTQRYIDGFGTMFAGMGVSPTPGRVFGYLLLLSSPVSLDQMAVDLGGSKSSISVAARQLEQIGMARRIPQRGSRRVLYEAVDSFEGLVEADNQRRAMFLEKVRQGMAIVPDGPAAERMEAFARLFQFTIDETRGMLQRWRERK
jgi:predicted transcriptional regulator